DQRNDERRKDRAGVRAGIEDARGEGPLLFGEPLAHALDGAGKVGGLAEAEQRARGGKGRGGASERMADRREAPNDDRGGKVAAPSSNAPAFTSIQCGFFSAIAVLEEILSVGTGKPSGVPRPVVNRSSVAPLATNAVDETPSLPGDSRRDNPPARVAAGSP